jgi:NADH-quinone oxidoreductase subunit J
VTLEAAAFVGVAVALLGSSLAVVLSTNLFHAVLFLAASLVSTGLVFLLLDSPFLFAVQLLLYAGGVVTIAVFAIMLTERLVGERLTQTNRWILNGAVLSAAVFVGIAGFLLKSGPVTPASRGSGDPIAAIARGLTGTFAPSLELLAVLLVAALLGALYFARTED